MIRTVRIGSTSPTVATCVFTWDDETGEAEKIEYARQSRAVRRAVVRRFPRKPWDDDVVGETTWFDANDRIVRRTPALLGRSLALD